MLRWSRIAFVMLCSCQELFGLDVVDQPPPIDAAPDAAPDAAAPALAKWTAATSLPVGLDYNHPQAAFVGDTLYMIGGFAAGQGETAAVYRATWSEGTLGAWTPTTAIPAPRAFGDIVTIGPRIYVVGGANFGGAQATVYYGGTDAGGNIPSWSATTSLPSARKAHGAAAANSFLYVVGGADTLNARYMSVLFAPVRADGSLGTWQLTTPLPEPRANLSVVAAGGFLYAIGGDSTDSTIHATVFVAALDPNNGQVGSWAATTPLPVERRWLAAVTDGSHIYVIGGLGASASADVWYTRLSGDGTLGTWETSEPLLMPRYRHSGVLANGQLFVLGGAQANTSVEHSSQSLH